MSILRIASRASAGHTKPDFAKQREFLDSQDGDSTGIRGMRRGFAHLCTFRVIERSQVKFQGQKDMSRYARAFRSRSLCRWKVALRGVHLAARGVRHCHRRSAILHHLQAAVLVRSGRETSQAWQCCTQHHDCQHHPGVFGSHSHSLYLPFIEYDASAAHVTVI